MASAPYGVRLLLGAAVTAFEETLKLPQTILAYPMTVASQAANLVMHFQQNLAELAIKGDEALDQLFPPHDEQPEWATFDEDLDDGLATDGERLTEGRFALYTTGEPEAPAAAKKTARKTPAKAAKTDGKPSVPAVVAELDYAALTLAQLRARLPSLRVTELEELLAYEEATKSRAPFQTLLANRITRATAK
jgi:hypothetical protein